MFERVWVQDRLITFHETINLHTDFSISFWHSSSRRRIGRGSNNDDKDVYILSSIISRYSYVTSVSKTKSHRLLTSRTYAVFAKVLEVKACRKIREWLGGSGNPLKFCHKKWRAELFERSKYNGRKTLWHRDPLLGNDPQKSNIQHPLLSNGPKRSLFPWQQESNAVM